LFSNPPWWGETKAYADQATGRRFLMYTAGIRAGSRWPFTFMLPTPPDFTDCHLVINGATNLFKEVFGAEQGRHARTAIGTNVLPFDLAVEVDAVFEVK